ncbi:hypothetical protein MKW94_008652 [Papaver nudicaule]|uniref:CWF19-like protein 2 n=1 Tax=Papaver nudicaule TaxID=74823 RepID=A0AA41S2K7_PAPNU|nr:hypothetical protein [Papaver nudicaule]
MLSGIKFIPRDQLKAVSESDSGSNKKEKRRRKRKNKHTRSDSSSDDDGEGTEKIKGKSKNKWYSSEEYSSGSDSEDSDVEAKRSRGKNKKKSKRRKKHRRSTGSSSSESESEEEGRRRKRESKKKERGRRAEAGEGVSDSVSRDVNELARKEAGLDWMLKPKHDPERISVQTATDVQEEPQVEEVKKPSPRELNPYYKNDGGGFPEDEVQTKVRGSQLLSSSVVGDGGASWRLKALKRAQEQAARDGRKLEEVVGERWGSLSQLDVSAAARAAPNRAHLHAIRDRKRTNESISDDKVNPNGKSVNDGKRNYLKDVSVRQPEMREPKVHDSLSWRKRKGTVMSKETAQVISAAASSLNKFANDGSFLRQLASNRNKEDDDLSCPPTNVETVNMEVSVGSSGEGKHSEESAAGKQELSANQLAAKAMQLRMKGKHDDADKLMKEVEIMKKKDSESKVAGHGAKGTATRHVLHKLSLREKEKVEDADMNLAQNIVHNKQYGRADDEYDFEVGPNQKRNKKKVPVPEQNKNFGIASRIMTQQERCQFCFENPTRPKHLVVAIANFTYLMLPQWQPVVQGHCYILPMQHEAATRNIDDDVWDEIRNFKKCLIMMFAKQDKEVVFLETVMDIAKQRRHCLVECIPLPRQIAKQAPLYFKKAIDEAESEWSQHNSKRLIDTSKKGLRGSIPKDFPYFHVEFGLDKGFVHVIDDETQFKSNIGINVIRGMLQLPEEDMYRRRQKNDSIESQKHAVGLFAKEWEQFDWTKQLG